MLWLKRNLVLVISGVVTLILLVVGVLYFLSGVQENKAREEALAAATNELGRLYAANPFPHSTNISRARDLASRARSAVNETRKHFVPIPFSNVRDQQFKTLLDNTIAELTLKAAQSGVRLPETNYAFTFKAQKTLVKFAEGSWPGLPQSLADIKTLCTLVFEAKCHLLNLRRERLTTDDPPGSTEFTELKRDTDASAGLTLVPYEVVISCFSAQIGSVLEAFARSSHGLVVKVLAVEPLSGQSAEVTREARPGATPVGGAGAPGGATAPPVRGGRRPFAPPPAARATGVLTEASDNEVVLIQQSLKVTLLVRVVRPAESGGGSGAGAGPGPGPRPGGRRGPPPEGRLGRQP
jgi:hypothetical protein